MSRKVWRMPFTGMMVAFLGQTYSKRQGETELEEQFERVFSKMPKR